MRKKNSRSPLSKTAIRKAVKKIKPQKCSLNNIVVISDTHCGCRLGMVPPGRIKLDDGGWYVPSKVQRKMQRMWKEFWEVFVPEATKGEPYFVVHNGDLVEGVHHNTTSLISHNLNDQAEIAYKLMAPIVDACSGRYYQIRGTPAHVGQQAVDEEKLARRLGAIPNGEGQSARWELWKEIGPKKLIHFLHHVGTVGAATGEATAVHREMVDSFTEAARWNRRPPDCIIRSHRHRYIMTEMATGKADRPGVSISATTPAWQGKTNFVFKIAGGRITQPQFGGLVIRYDRGELFIRPRVWSLDREKPE